jgi:addiction module RelE/StbE family toxin
MAFFVFSTRNFEKAIKKLPPKIIAAYKDRFSIFLFDPYHKILNNHKLKGQLRNYRSINITGDYRLIYEEYDDVTIRLIDIGTHGRIYGR